MWQRCVQHDSPASHPKPKLKPHGIPFLVREDILCALADSLQHQLMYIMNLPGFVHCEACHCTSICNDPLSIPS